MEMIDQLTNVRKMALVEKEPRGRIIAVTSGKGGVGKTNFALNLSLALTKTGKSVTLFDADTRLANVDVLLGKQSAYTLADVVFNGKSFSDIVLEDPSGLKVFSAGAGSIDLPFVDAGIKEHYFKEIYKQRHTNDFLIIDTSAGLSDFMIDFVLNADDVVVVTTPEPTAINDAYALVKLIYGMDMDVNILTLVNQVRSKDEAEELFERFSLVTEHFLNAETEYLGCVVEDRHVRSAVRKQEPFMRLHPGSKASKCIVEIARRWS